MLSELEPPPLHTEWWLINAVLENVKKKNVYLGALIDPREWFDHFYFLSILIERITVFVLLSIFFKKISLQIFWHFASLISYLYKLLELFFYLMYLIEISNTDYHSHKHILTLQQYFLYARKKEAITYSLNLPHHCTIHEDDP